MIRVNITILLFGILTACSSDLDIIYEHETVPVVYAIINPYDSVHYVKVQKTLTINIKDDWNKLNSDSLQFDKVDVYLSGKKDDQIEWTVQFSKTPVVREDGFFPAEGAMAFVYYGCLPIEYGRPEQDSLILEVTIHDLNLTTRAAAPILHPAEIINYKSRYSIYVYGSYPSVYALSPTGDNYFNSDYSVRYQQIEFRVHYREIFTDHEEAKELWWATCEGWDDNAYFITPTRLFNPILNGLSDDETVVYRKLDSIDIALMKPNRFFDNYWMVREYWEDSDRPPYTNFDNSYGMFFTIARDEWTGMQLFWRDLDSLCEGQYYKGMKFRKE